MSAFTQSSLIADQFTPILEKVSDVYNKILRKTYKFISRYENDPTLSQHDNDLAKIRAARASLSISSYLKESILIDLEGKIKSRKACWKLDQDQCRQSIEIILQKQHERLGKIQKLRKRLADDRTSLLKSHRSGKETKRSLVAQQRRSETIAELTKLRFIYHQKQRLLQSKRDHLTYLEKHDPVMNFGGYKLWNQQYHLQDNHCANHTEWLKSWQEKRSSSFTIVGRKKEPFGNRMAQIRGNELHLEIPAFDTVEPQKIIIPVQFRNPEKLIDKAVTIRFHRGKRGWYVYATTMDDEIQYKNTHNTVGIDINPSSIDLVAVDNIGKFIESKSISLSLGGTSSQNISNIRNACVDALKFTSKNNASLVLEKLDFRKKKQSLKETCSKNQARMLSSFAYQKIIESLESRSAKEKTPIYTVNPAYTSFIGVIALQSRYGLGGQTSAAMAIAHRWLACDADVLSSYASVVQVDTTLPVEDQWKRLYSAVTKAELRNGKPFLRHEFRVKPGAIPSNVLRTLLDDARQRDHQVSVTSSSLTG